MFNNYELYYNKLYKFLKSKPFIKGIDLDVEEFVTLDDIKMLIRQIDTDFGKDYIITMAPVAGALIYDYPGLGGFVYKHLYLTEEGQRINWFNGQFYGSYTENIYSTVIMNKYSPEKIVMGMIYYQFNKDNFEVALKTIKDVKNKYNNFGGVFVWEYMQAPSIENKNPEDWCIDVQGVLKY